MTGSMKAISKIADFRERTGLTQAQLAVFVGVTTNTIQNWESGKSGVEQIEKFLKLCEVLDCNLQDLIEYVPDSEAEEPKAGSFSLDDLRDLRERWGTKKKIQPKDIQLTSQHQRKKEVEDSKQHSKAQSFNSESKL